MKEFAIKNDFDFWLEVEEFLNENGYEFEEQIERGDDFPHTIIVEENVYEKLVEKFN